ncbi:MAG: DUF1080 domain-containing protein [Phycisphaerales bacterium]|nr:DUF1080 domain-containing protein [Phycisphaerales bacterium]
MRVIRLFAALLMGLLLAPASFAQDNQLTAEQREQGWKLLFDGQSLRGWTPTGNPVAWVAEEGMIQCRPGGGGWLRTVDQYRDFELFADFKISKGGNSGLAIRASSTSDPAFSGMELQIYDSCGKPTALNCCGAVYNAIAPTEQAVKPAGEWNTYRVLIKGDTLNVWLNGRQIHKDERLDSRGIVHQAQDKRPLQSRIKSGYIAFQDHGNGAYFKNIRIRPIDVHPLDAAPGKGEPMWVDLFNGRDLTGWFARGDATWSVEDGVLVGRDGVGHLYSDGVYTDFELRAKVWIKTKGNSGFYFRANPPEDNPDSWPEGYEAQVDNNDPKNFTGSLYARAWPDRLITKEEEWFDYNVRCVGEHITIAINGQTMLETDQHDYASGRIALQGHNPGSEVRWRDIQIRPLNESIAMSKPIPPADGIIDVFYCTHSAGFRHDVLPESRQIMEQLGQQHDWLRVVTSDDIADLTPERLAQTDVVMFYTTGELPMSDEQKQALVEFCESGHGFVGVHSATDTFYEWPWYVKHVGGSFDGHPWHEKVTIDVLDTNHPATRHLGGEFIITDEIYKFKNNAEDRHVLTQLDGSSVEDRANGYFPDSSWTRTTGNGRMFYTALGHRSEVWRDQRFIDHLLGGIRWAAGVEE